jgi:cytochrome P450
MSLEIDEAALPELDVRSEEFSRDPHGILRRLRQLGPMARSHRGIEVLSFELCAAIFANDEFETLGLDHFRDMGAPTVLVSFVEHGLLLNMERERHDRIRRVMSRAFSIRRVDEQRQVMRDVARELLGPILAAGACDLVADFTERYPMEVLCRLLGVPPDDIPSFHQAAIDLHLMGAVPLAPAFPRLEEALALLWDFVHELVEKRRAEPREDFISALIDAQAQEAELTDEEVVWNLVNLLFAGQDTTRYQVASAVREFIAIPGLWDVLANDPSMVTPALEEAMRLRPVSQFVVRRAAFPADAGGFRFPAKRRVILNLLAASRDPSAFRDPDAFALDRDTAYRLPFGWGLHYCLGHALARAEMCEAITLLTQSMNCPSLGRTSEAPTPAMLGGPESLSISFTRRD